MCPRGPWGNNFIIGDGTMTFESHQQIRIQSDRLCKPPLQWNKVRFWKLVQASQYILIQTFAVCCGPGLSDQATRCSSSVGAACVGLISFQVLLMSTREMREHAKLRYKRRGAAYSSQCSSSDHRYLAGCWGETAANMFLGFLLG